MSYSVRLEDGTLVTIASKETWGQREVFFADDGRMYEWDAEGDYLKLAADSPAAAADADTNTDAALTWVNVVGGVGLQNAWAVNTEFGTPAFAVDEAKGLIYMRGGLDSTLASAATAFTLPAAARPSAKRTCSIFNATFLTVTTAGAVQGPTAALYVVLDGVVLSL